MPLFVRLDLRYMPDLRPTLFSKALNPFSYYLYLFIFQSAVHSPLLHNNTGTTAEAPDAVAVYTLYAAFPRDPALTPVASRHSLINPFPRLLIIVWTRRRYRGLEPLPTRSECVPVDSTELHSLRFDQNLGRLTRMEIYMHPRGDHTWEPVNIGP